MQITTLSELTIDGKLSLGPGASSKDLFAFYGDELKAWFHRQRSMHDAIMVGANTVRNDDPELTVRYVKGKSPLRIVPASKGLLPLEARVLNDGFPTLVVVSAAASPEALASLKSKPRVEVVCCGEERIDLAQLMKLLELRGIKSLLVEGGSRLLHSLFEDGMVSRIIIKHIPVISGATDAPTYLQEDISRSQLKLSQWQIEQWFVMSGVGVSVYGPLNPPLKNADD